MKVSEINFKGVKAIKLENEELSVIVIPDFGSKVASIIHKESGFELLYQPHNDGIQLPEVGCSFGDYDPFGYDDCFPTIDEDEHVYDGSKIIYPDHGETWAGRFEYELKEESLDLSYTSQMMNYTYEKTMRLEEEALLIDFNITSTGQCPLDCFYTFHGLLNMNTDVEIVLPDEVKQVVNVCDISALGDVGRIVDYPVAKTVKGEDLVLNRVKDASAAKCEKYYAPDKVNEGKCSVLYHKEGLRFDLEYDPEKLPYLGVWINEMGVLDHYNLALEPSNGFFDKISRAKAEDKYLELLPGESFVFSLKLTLEPLTIT